MKNHRKTEIERHIDHMRTNHGIESGLSNLSQYDLMENLKDKGKRMTHELKV